MNISSDELRLVRDYMDLTQAEMAAHLGVSPRTVVNWETSGVPASKAERVARVLGSSLGEAKAQKRFLDEAVHSTPSEDDYARWASEQPSYEEEVVPGMSADQRRAHLLQAFTDSDLLNELKSRAMRRGDRASHWNAARMERYQRFVAPKWGDDEDPDYSKMSDQDVYGLAAREGDANIGHDEIPNET
jgi:transcriptional regulator with XRE-family HTH domain